MYRPILVMCSLAAAAAAPVTTDQSQEGDLNFHADVQNVVILVAIPQKLSVPFDILDGLVKLKSGREAQDRSDMQSMEAFVEPSTPYRVEIGPDGSDRAAGEVVIASRRHADGEPQLQREELKLLGATEQCGPEGERDPVTLTCRLRAAPLSEPEPEPQPSPQPAPVPAPEVTQAVSASS